MVMGTFATLHEIIVVVEVEVLMVLLVIVDITCNPADGGHYGHYSAPGSDDGGSRDVPYGGGLESSSSSEPERQRQK